MAGLVYEGFVNQDPVAMGLGVAGMAVETVAPLYETVVNLFSNRQTSYNPQDGSTVVDTSTENDSEELRAIDTEPLRRAFETVNYVLRNFGCRITEAQMLSDAALIRALGNATAHIEVKLFSPDMNLLFRSLQARRTDMVLMQSVMASIYFLGALIAELAPSLPQYKDTYPSLGPHVATQFILAAIGEDAFAQDRYEKEKAFKTLAATAGLLRPTDIGYATFPGFPSFSPSAYSSRKSSDVRAAKNLFEKMTKHFEKHGFPQPRPDREVGPIADWRFLSGDTNNRLVEVEKADKQIGDNFGRVVYWLICSASRMPVDRAVIAYHDQHRELVRWIGKRTGFRVLTFADLDMTPKPHAKMDTKLKALLQTWLIIMPPLVPDERANQQPQHFPHVQVRQSVYSPQKPVVQPQGYFPPQQVDFAPQPYYPGVPLNPTQTGMPPGSPNAPPAYSPIPAPVGGGAPPPQQFSIRRKAPPAPKPISFARALHDFWPEEEDYECLPFKAGEVLEISDKVSHANDGWWVGKLRGGNGKMGLVPASYLTVEDQVQF